MSKNSIDNLISKHLSGEISSEEQNEFRLWLNSNSKNRAEFNKIALTYQMSKGKSNHTNKSKVFSRLHQKIEVERSAVIIKSKPNFSYKIRVAIAASIIVFIALGIIFYTNYKKIEPVAHQFELIKKVNPAGQKSKIFLPDGSIAWLNSESLLSYESGFNDSVRYVEMEGEAYFEVRKDASRPFIVKSKALTTTALGTAFNINTFNEADEVLVALTSGKISVENNGTEKRGSKIIIYPGEGILYKPFENVEMSKISIDVEGVKRWKDGVLELKNATLNETIDLLSRWYGTKLIIKNKPNRTWNASGVFDNEYLENVLTTLSFSQGFEFDIERKQVYITFKKE